MNFYSVRDLRTTPKAIWGNLALDGEVVITNNGKPTALLVNLEDYDFETTVKAVRQAKAMMAFNSMRSRASENGFMTDDEIEAEIAATFLFQPCGLKMGLPPKSSQKFCKANLSLAMIGESWMNTGMCFKDQNSSFVRMK